MYVPQPVVEQPPKVHPFVLHRYQIPDEIKEGIVQMEIDGGTLVDVMVYEHKLKTLSERYEYYIIYRTCSGLYTSFSQYSPTRPFFY